MSVIRRRDRSREYWVSFRFHGRRVRRRSVVQTQRGAQEFERRLLREFAEDTDAGRDPFTGPPPTLATFADRFMRDYAMANNRRSTIREKRSAFNAHLIPTFGHLPLNRITAATVDQAIAKWKRSGVGVKRISNLLCVLRKALRVAEEWQLIRRAPHVRHLKVDIPDPVFLDRKQYHALLDSMDPGVWRTLVLFIVTTGVRFGEAAALKWSDLHLDTSEPWVRIERAVEHGQINPPKTRAGLRTIPLIPETARALANLPHDREYVFSPPTGGFYRPNTCSHVLRAACRAAGVPEITWHKLRHTCATDLLMQGVPMTVVKGVLGHASIAMTDRYGHVVPSNARAFMNVLSGLDDGSTVDHNSAAST